MNREAKRLNEVLAYNSQYALKINAAQPSDWAEQPQGGQLCGSRMTVEWD